MMELKLVRMEKDEFGRRTYISYEWKYGPVSGEKEKWEVVKKLADGFEKIGDVSSIRVLGPDHGDKELSDIGEKHYDTPEEMIGDIDKILKDENYSVDINVAVGDRTIPVSVQFIGDVIDIYFDGKEKEAKLIATVVKKTLG